eukprot:10583187-Heterocapsa_arctica.AAC.2
MRLRRGLSNGSPSTPACDRIAPRSSPQGRFVGRACNCRPPPRRLGFAPPVPGVGGDAVT